MFRKSFLAIAATVALTLSLGSFALAADDWHTLLTAPAEPREVLTLAPGDSEATADVKMRPEVCAAFLRVLRGHSERDCMTRVTLSVHGLPGRGGSGVSSPIRTPAASYWCGVTVDGTMANIGWRASVSQTFCIWPYVYVYPKPYGTQCGNYYAFYATVTITWCGGGRSGWTADGGENVTITTWYWQYGAGQRVTLSADWRTGQWCWNAFC